MARETYVEVEVKLEWRDGSHALPQFVCLGRIPVQGDFISYNGKEYMVTRVILQMKALGLPDAVVWVG